MRCRFESYPYILYYLFNNLKTMGDYSEMQIEGLINGTFSEEGEYMGEQD